MTQNVAEPTHHSVGTIAKVELLTMRAELGIELFVDGDSLSHPTPTESNALKAKGVEWRLESKNYQFCKKTFFSQT